MGSPTEISSIRVYIRKLWESFGAYNSVIQMVYDKGYRLDDISKIDDKKWDEIKKRYEEKKEKSNAFSQREDIQIHNLTLSPREELILLEGEVLPLFPLQFKILFILASYPNQAFTKHELKVEMENILGDSYTVWLY